jgi:hypothetical protein
MTPPLQQLHAQAVALQAGALADSTRVQYSQYELYWVQFLIVFGLMSFVLAPTEAGVTFYVAFLSRSVSFGAIKNYLQGVQRFPHSFMTFAFRVAASACRSTLCGSRIGRIEGQHDALVQRHVEILHFCFSGVLFTQPSCTVVGVLRAPWGSPASHPGDPAWLQHVRP